MIYMFLSNNPSSGDINSSNLSCFPMHSEDRNDRDQIEHMLALILAIDV